MKKFLIGIIISVFLVGCSSKQVLSCESFEEGVSLVVDLSFKKDKIQKVSTSITLEYDDEFISKKLISTLEGDALKQFSEYIAGLFDMAGAKVVFNDDDISIVSDISVAEAIKMGIFSEEIFNEMDDIEDLKVVAEKSGATCKIT